jgi:hypothetical protein
MAMMQAQGASGFEKLEEGTHTWDGLHDEPRPLEPWQSRREGRDGRLVTEGKLMRTVSSNPSQLPRKIEEGEECRVEHRGLWSRRRGGQRKLGQLEEVPDRTGDEVREGAEGGVCMAEGAGQRGDRHGTRRRDVSRGVETE